MSVWVKICGNTSLADALVAAEAGADALGFVFAPSPRHVTVEQVAEISHKLPNSVEKIGVFVDATFDEIASAARLAGLTGVQLHSASPGSLTMRLRDEFGRAMRILRVVHFGASAAAEVAALATDASFDALLIDSRTATAVGGTGVSFNWTAARTMLFTGERKMVAAGGLNPDNVAEAIATLRPWGVDVVTGVEAAPGQKDAAKVRSFVAAARAASR